MPVDKFKILKELGQYRSPRNEILDLMQEILKYLKLSNGEKKMKWPMVQKLVKRIKYKVKSFERRQFCRDSGAFFLKYTTQFTSVSINAQQLFEWFKGEYYYYAGTLFLYNIPQFVYLAHFIYIFYFYTIVIFLG